MEKKKFERGFHKALCLLSKAVLKSGLQSDKATSGRHALGERQVPGC